MQFNGTLILLYFTEMLPRTVSVPEKSSLNFTECDITLLEISEQSDNTEIENDNDTSEDLHDLPEGDTWSSLENESDNERTQKEAKTGEQIHKPVISDGKEELKKKFK